MPNTTTMAELQRRLVYTLLQPAMAVCRRFAMPLDVMETLCRLAYFAELRRDGEMTQAEVARIFGKSRRTVVAVERLFQSDFLAPAEEVHLSRRLEEELATGPISAEELAGRLDDMDPVLLERRLESLVTAGRARREPTEPATYTLLERYQSLVRDDLLARLDGLRHQLDVFSTAVRRRFLGNGAESAPTVARTVSFVGTAEDVRAMSEELIRSLRLQAIDVEESALAKGGYERYGVTLAVAPMERPGQGEKR